MEQYPQREHVHALIFRLSPCLLGGHEVRGAAAWLPPPERLGHAQVENLHLPVLAEGKGSLVQSRCQGLPDQELLDEPGPFLVAADIEDRDDPGVTEACRHLARPPG